MTTFSHDLQHIHIHIQMKINGIIILRPINYFNCLIMWRWVRIPNNVCVSESCCCFYIRHKEKGERNNVIIVLWSATSLFELVSFWALSSLLIQCNWTIQNYQRSRVRVSLSLSLSLRARAHARSHELYHFIGLVRVFPTRLFSHALFTLNWPLLEYTDTHTHTAHFIAVNFPFSFSHLAGFFFSRFFSKLLWFALFFIPLHSHTHTLTPALSLLSFIATSVI